MRTVLIAALLVLAPLASAQGVEFYAGDGDGRNGLSSEKNGLITGGAWTFEDFDHAGGPIAAVWGNFLINYAALESVHYEIRSGIRQGDGGKLHASGTLANPTYLPTGRVYFGFTERHIKGGVSIANLPAGHYYLAIQPRQTAAGRAFITTASFDDLGPTSDPNPPPAGTPRFNNNSWFHSEHFGTVYSLVTTQLGNGVWDFSYGIEIPEPSGVALLALSAAALLRKR